MKVAISLGGKFHAFQLAKQLLKRGHLSRLITSYPKFSTRKSGIPDEYVKSIFIKEILERGSNKLKLTSLFNPQFIIHEIFDYLAEKYVQPVDIFVGWANFSLRSMRKAKSLGAKGIIERGSSHIMYQNDILKEEFERWGAKSISFSTPHPKIIEKELKEYEEADYISIPSKYVKQTFLDKGIPESKLIHVPYGVDLSRFRQIPKKDNVFRVIFVGGMMLRKGVHYLLQAFSELNLPNSELLLVGKKNSDIEPFFKKYDGKFKWIGHVPHGELYKYYSEGSVFVFASIEEGLGLVQLEAMACGLPIIATINTGAEDIIQDGKNGFIIPIRDTAALKEKLVYLYENPDKRKEMGEFAKKHVSSGFTWDDYGENITKAYTRVLKDA